MSLDNYEGHYSTYENPDNTDGRLQKDFTLPDKIPEESKRNVEALLESGRLFRYSPGPKTSETSRLEQEFADYMGKDYALAVNSCSSALFLSLLSTGVDNGSKVLIPGFTFTAVPSSIVHAGAEPVLVECTKNYTIDTDDLRGKITGETQHLLLSHMRGHVADMDEIHAICEEHGLTLIEDCAHSLGVHWNGTPTGADADVACFSFQSFKMINGGEGGLLVTDDEDIITDALLYSGCYEEKWKTHTFEVDRVSEEQTKRPKYNMRMTELQAAVIRPQIDNIEEKSRIWTRQHNALAERLSASEHIFMPERDNQVTQIAPDTIQFTLQKMDDEQVKDFVERVNDAGLPLKVFGQDEKNARCYWNWDYLPNTPNLPRTRQLLERTCDLRLPLYLDDADIEDMGDIILESIELAVES